MGIWWGWTQCVDLGVSSKLPGTGKWMSLGGDSGYQKGRWEVMWSLYPPLALHTRKPRSRDRKSLRSYSKWLAKWDLELVLWTYRSEEKSASQNGILLPAPLCWNPHSHSPPSKELPSQLVKDIDDSHWLLEVVMAVQRILNKRTRGLPGCPHKAYQRSFVGLKSSKPRYILSWMASLSFWCNVTPCIFFLWDSLFSSIAFTTQIFLLMFMHSKEVEI